LDLQNDTIFNFKVWSLNRLIERCIRNNKKPPRTPQLPSRANLENPGHLSKL
jgi:hypothetical protein